MMPQKPVYSIYPLHAHMCVHLFSSLPHRVGFPSRKKRKIPVTRGNQPQDPAALSTSLLTLPVTPQATEKGLVPSRRGQAFLSVKIQRIGTMLKVLS